MNILRVTVGHLRPIFDVGLYSRHLVCSKQFDSDLVVTPPEIGGLDDSKLSEYYMLFGLARFLTNRSEYTHVNIAHYRRFVSKVKIGRTAKNQNYTQLVHSTEAQEAYQAQMEVVDKDFIIGQPMVLSPIGVFAQFGKHHPLSELFKILVKSNESGLLTNDFLFKLASTKYLFPAPTVGMFPVRYFIETMTLLESIVRICHLSNIPSSYEGYQLRIIAFCLERIHSQHLLMHLEHIDRDRLTIGYQCVVGEGDFVIASGRQ